MAKPKIGRPRIEIDWDIFEKLCAIHCTLTEIAAWFNCSIDTIENAVKREYKCRFSEVYEQKKGLGKIALRRQMHRLVEQGNPTMLIWLSKQWLKMADKIEQKTDATVKSEEKVVVYLPHNGSEA